MATERSAVRARPSGAAYVEALRAWRAIAARSFNREGADRPLVSTARADRFVYAGTAAAFLLTAVPFWLASADGVTPGPDGIPAPRLWDALGRARGLVLEGPLPLAPGTGPFSPLWTWMLAIPYGLLGWMGLSTDFLAKLFGWLAALGAGIGLYNVALTATARRWPGVLALALLALDPTLAFGRVSGSEAPLFAALTAFAGLAAVRGRTTVLAWLLAAIVLTRPDGALVVVLAALVLAIELLWRGGQLSREPEQELGILLRVVLPAAAALGVWALYSLATSRSALPPLWPTGADAAGGPAAVARALWNGLLSLHPSFATGFAAATLAAWGWLGAAFVRVWGTRGLFPTLIPATMILSAGAGGPPGVEAWSYDATRLVEPALYWLDLALAIGLAAAGSFIWRRSGAGMPAALRSSAMERVVACLPLLFWLLSGGLLWLRATSDYAWGARNVAELPFAAGRWLAANAPPGARVGLGDGAEAVRGSATQPTRDVLSTPDARAVAQEQGLLYLVAFEGTGAAEWPMAREVLRLGTLQETALPSTQLAVYRLDWSLARLEDAVPGTLNLAGYEVVDALDVGDDASETRHFYSSPSRGRALRVESAAPIGWLEDEGRAQAVGRGAESFQLAARPGQDFVVAVRYDNRARGTLRFTVGADTAELRLRDCGYRLCEDAAVVVPNSRVRGPSARVDVALVNGPAGYLATFHYWSLARP